MTPVAMRRGRHRRFSRASLVFGAQRRRCRRGIHVSGETHDIGAGIARTLCSACGAVAAIDLRSVDIDSQEGVEIRTRRLLWQ